MAETLTMARALNLGLRRALESDDRVLIMGEDVGKLGGVFRVTDSLQKDFGDHRVLDTPLAESGIMGTAIGLAMRGYRPVVEIQFDGFVYPAYDQMVSQLAKLHARSSGQVPMPVTVRIPYGGGIGAVEHHSESPEAYFAHTAGLRVVSPSNATDASCTTTRRPVRSTEAHTVSRSIGESERRSTTSIERPSAEAAIAASRHVRTIGP